MRPAGNKHWKYAAGAFLLLCMLAAAANAATAPAAENLSQWLARTESIKTLNYPLFAKQLHELESHAAEMSDAQKLHLRYLEGWQSAYAGQSEKAKALLETVASQAADSSLRTKATSVLINLLGVEHRYEEAFQYLDRALESLPKVPDAEARAHILGEASQLLSEAGQYDLAAGYAKQIITQYPTGRHNCLGHMYELHAELRSGQAPVSPALFQDGIDRCLAVGEKLAADNIRRDMALLAMQQNKPGDAIAILERYYAEVKGFEYPDLLAQYDVLLAKAYWEKNDIPLAQKYATAAADLAARSDLTESVVNAYQMLYQIERQYGNLRDALAYHEKYVTADKEHLDDLREKALAYQVVKQEVEAKKAELDTLNKRNQILQLQQALDRKAVVTSRLYIALLLSILASIAFWLYRLKRSQLRFMRLARRDGLTGIFNRQHFMEEAEQSLRYVARSLRGACLILIDLDHFKEINDTHGHVVGDAVLKRAVAICQCQLNSCDVFGRIGGEEFGILLPECTLMQALERAERIRLAMQQVDGDDEVALTASFGIAATAHYGYTLRRLLIAADGALYRAKREGRNRVVVSMDEHRTATSSDSSTRTGAHPYANSSE